MLAAILPRFSLDHKNTCCDAINRHCLFNSLCDRRSQGKFKIIADRQSFLVGHDYIKVIQSSSFEFDSEIDLKGISDLDIKHYVATISDFFK